MSLRDELITQLAGGGVTPSAPAPDLDTTAHVADSDTNNSAGNTNVEDEREGIVADQLEGLNEQVEALTAELDQVRSETESRVQEVQASADETVAEKDEVIASLQQQIETLRTDLIKRDRVAEIARELSEDEQTVIASMTDEQFELYKKTATAPAAQAPYRRSALQTDDGNVIQRVTL